MGDMTYLPDCWDDEERMVSMFLDFRNKNVNPTAWLSKMYFWIECVNKFCSVKNKVLFDVNDLERAFERQNKVPAALDAVIAQMKSERKIVTYAEFLNVNKTQGWLQWGYDLAVKKPLSFGWSTLKFLMINDSGREEDQFVNLTVLKEKSDMVHLALKNHNRVIFTFEEVYGICKGLDIAKESADVILISLENNKFLKMVSNKEGQFIQLNDGKASTTVEMLAKEEIKFIRIKAIQGKLEKEVQRYEQLIEQQVIEAKKLLKSGSRSLAKNSLRRKKRYEDILAKKEMALENIQVLMNRIEDAESNRMIAEAYKAGVDAYKNKISCSGLKLESLDDVMASVQEVLDMHEDISETMSSPLDTTYDTSQEELEQELAEIIATNQSKEIEEGDDIAYPKVPANDSVDDLEARFANLRPSTGTQAKVSNPKKPEKTQIAS